LLRGGTRGFKGRGGPWIGLRISVVSNRYTAPLYADIERRYGLLRDEAAVLIAVANDEGSSAQEIVEHTGRPKNTISRAVRKLETDGDSTDKRSGGRQSL